MTDKLEAAGLAVIEAAIADAEQDFKRPHLRSHLLGARVQGNRPRASMQPAGATARANDWTRGTHLVSEKWSKPREILQVNGEELLLRAWGQGGSTWVKTIPKDVAVTSRRPEVAP